MKYVSPKDSNYYHALARRKDIRDFVKLNEGLVRVVIPGSQKVRWLVPQQELWCQKVAELKISGVSRGIWRRAAEAAGYGQNSKTDELRKSAMDNASIRNRRNRACFHRITEIIREKARGR